jgi:hypothetical protein
MAKRLTREQKKEKALVDIIDEMFRIAGHDVTFNDIKDRKDNWFQQYTMTVAQNEQWQAWGKKYLQKTFRTPAKLAEREMQWTSLQYGLSFSDFPGFGPYNTEEGVIL